MKTRHYMKRAWRAGWEDDTPWRPWLARVLPTSAKFMGLVVATAAFAYYGGALVFAAIALVAKFCEWVIS